MRPAIEIIEIIRAALDELDTHPEADHIVSVLWRDLANRRPSCSIFGVPTEPVPVEPPRK